jgi:transcriptional regulator with XRE-family HTH domain
VTNAVDPYYRRLGELLRKQRAQKRITQEALGAHLGLSRTSIVNIEKGRQHIAVHQLARIADYLGCTVADLIPSLTEEHALSEVLRAKAPDEGALTFLTSVSTEAERKR